MAYHREHGVDVRVVRIFNTYGPYLRPGDGRAIPNFLSQALAGEPLTIYGDGSQTRSFTYVDDEVDGILRLLESDWVGPMNIGNPEEYTILELAQAVPRRDRVRARSSCSSRCRATTPRCAAPTSPWPARCSAGRRRCRCARASSTRRRGTGPSCSRPAPPPPRSAGADEGPFGLLMASPIVLQVKGRAPAGRGT